MGAKFLRTEQGGRWFYWGRNFLERSRGSPKLGSLSVFQQDFLNAITGRGYVATILAVYLYLNGITKRTKDYCYRSDRKHKAGTCFTDSNYVKNNDVLPRHVYKKSTVTTGRMRRPQQRTHGECGGRSSGGLVEMENAAAAAADHLRREDYLIHRNTGTNQIIFSDREGIIRGRFYSVL